MKKSRIKYLIMEHLGIRLTTYCNLNCKDCADLIPYTRDCHYDITLMEEDMDKLFQVVDCIEEILLIGGEVLMYPELYRALRYFIDSKKVGRIIITTNGTIMPSNEITELLKSDKVIVRVSGYGEDVAPNRGELVRMLGRENIPIEDLEGMSWGDVGNAECRNRSQQEIEMVWDMCLMNSCVTMTERGRIYFCSRAIAADDLGYGPKPGEMECVDVRNTPVEELGEKLEAFYDLNYISTCNYCDGLTGRTPVVPTAAQMVSKHTALELFQYEFRLRDEKTNNEVLLNWMEFVAPRFQEFVYEEEIKKALEVTLKAHEQNNPQGAIKAWNELNHSLFSRYDFVVENKSDVIRDSACKGKKTVGKRKNTLFVLVTDDEHVDEESMSKADIIISSAEIKAEKRWESETGLKSILRYAFDFERM